MTSFVRRFSSFAVFMLLPVASPRLAGGEKPNVAVIVADDLGYAEVSFHEKHAKEVSTPHLDALAAAGIVCRQGYVSGHVCSPTRAGLMTGRYQQRLGLYTGGEAGSGLPLGETLLPGFLKAAGYATGQFGKWHLGPTLEWSPVHRGFDEVYGFLGRGAHDYFKLDDPEDPIYRGLEPVRDSGYLTDRLGEETAAFIRKQRTGRPFFAYLAFNAVHAPMQAPEEEIAKFDTGDPVRNTRLAMGRRLDDAVGRVIAALKESGAWENTLVFFLSDNGGPLAQSADNTPLRGGKHTDYEGGVRVPFVVSWPARLKPGGSDAVVSALDILPTALAAAGVAMPADRPADGIDLIPVLSGEKPAPTRDLFWCSGGEEGWWAVRSGDWKLVAERERIELFDLAADPGEATDLAASKPDQVAELTRRHDVWLAAMADPVKAGAKRWAPGGESEKPRKKSRMEKEERRKQRAGETPAK
jgi:arylsulfatase A-like enzyme